METFLNISANPTFARTVTELVYDGRLFLPELAAYKPFKEAFGAHREDGYNHDDADTADADQAGDSAGPTNYVDDDATTLSWSAISGWRNTGDERYHQLLANDLLCYTRLVDQQQSIFEGEKDHEALCTGLENLPNITAVIVLDNFSQCCDWTPLRADDHSWYNHRSRHETAVLAPSQWPQNKYRRAQLGRSWDVRGVQNLIRAVSVHCQELKELQLASERSKAPLTIFEMDEDGHDKACTIAQRLTSLKINLYIDWAYELQEQYEGLDAFLTKAVELRCFAWSGRIRSEKDKVWPHLETLNWGDLDLDAAGLKAFIRAHKGTLRELTFRNVYMYGEEGWAEAAKEIGKYLRLRSVSVLGVCDNVTNERTGWPYLEDETNLAVARSFMQSIPRTILSDEHHFTIIVCPGECEVGDSHTS